MSICVQTYFTQLERTGLSNGAYRKLLKERWSAAGAQAGGHSRTFGSLRGKQKFSLFACPVVSFAVLPELACFLPVRIYIIYFIESLRVQKISEIASEICDDYFASATRNCPAVRINAKINGLNNTSLETFIF